MGRKSSPNGEEQREDDGTHVTPRDPDVAGPNNPREWVMYLAQLPGLWAGRAVPTYPLNSERAASLDDAAEGDLALLLDVARSQLDQCEQQLDQIRQRSQFLFTTALVLVGLATFTLRAVITNASTCGFIVWLIAALSLLLALLGSVGVIVNRKVMGTIDAAWLTRQPKPWLRALVTDAMEAVEVSRTTVANQLTYFRDAVLLTIGGSLLLGAAWITAVF